MKKYPTIKTFFIRNQKSILIQPKACSSFFRQEALRQADGMCVWRDAGSHGCHPEHTVQAQIARRSESKRRRVWSSEHWCVIEATTWRFLTLETNHIGALWTDSTRTQPWHEQPLSTLHSICLWYEDRLATSGVLKCRCIDNQAP